MLINVEFDVLTLRNLANNQDIDSSKSRKSQIIEAAFAAAY